MAMRYFSVMKRWQDVRARVRLVDPEWDSPLRVAQRREMRAQMLASLDHARAGLVHSTLDGSPHQEGRVGSPDLRDLQ
jgi:hypothetical protein